MADSQERLRYPKRILGLDHGWFDFRSAPNRTKVAWPAGKPVALWITVPVEFFPIGGQTPPFNPLGGLERPYPDFWGYSNRDYGNRIGIYRIMRVLDEAGIRATALVNAAIAEKCPRVLKEIVARDWEVAGHGLDMRSPHHGDLSREDEAKMVSSAAAILRQATSQDVRGWHSPGHSQSVNTMDLLGENGFVYVADWANDDLPYAIDTAAGGLLSLPLSYEMSDRLLLAQHNHTASAYADQILAAFDRLRQEARNGGGRILSLNISPWIFGYPHRIAALRKIITTIMETDEVWPATGIEIVAHLAPTR